MSGTPELRKNMATRKTAIEEDKLTDANFQKVIYMLAPPEGSEFKAWTKKEACQFLGIAYNTTRLGTLLEKFKEKKDRDAQRRAALRGKAATADEISYAITEYLSGETIDSISKSTFRSSTFIRKLLEQYAVPMRSVGHTYFHPQLIPDEASRTVFKVGEIVYSARYESLARVDAEAKHPHHGNIYRIWLLADKWKQSAWQPAEELASLEHLRKIGVKV